MNNAFMREGRGGDCAGGGGAAAPGVAGWLGLATTPTFALMALWIGATGDQPDVLCASSHGALSLNGMAVMYALMSIFHVGAVANVALQPKDPHTPTAMRCPPVSV